VRASELKEWAASLPPDAKVEFMLKEVAVDAGYTDYRTASEKERNGGWVALASDKLRGVLEHPDRKPAQVAERLLK
jgi:hypothetical protein